MRRLWNLQSWRVADRGAARADRAPRGGDRQARAREAASPRAGRRAGDVRRHLESQVSPRILAVGARRGRNPPICGMAPGRAPMTKPKNPPARAPRRYLVTGGAGFIGSHIAAALTA